MQVRTGGRYHIAANIPLWGEIVIEHQPAGIPGNQGNPIAWLNEDVAVGIGGAVRFCAYLKVGLERGIDEAIRHMPMKSTFLTAERQVKALPARIADIIKVPSIGSSRDELDVISVDGMEYVRTPHQALMGKIAPSSHLEGAADHLLQIWTACKSVRQSARRGRVGAAECDDGRRAA